MTTPGFIPIPAHRPTDAVTREWWTRFLYNMDTVHAGFGGGLTRDQIMTVSAFGLIRRLNLPQGSIVYGDGSEVQVLEVPAGHLVEMGSNGVPITVSAATWRNRAASTFSILFGDQEDPMAESPVWTTTPTIKAVANHNSPQNPGVLVRPPVGQFWEVVNIKWPADERANVRAWLAQDTDLTVCPVDPQLTAPNPLPDPIPTPPPDWYQDVGLADGVLAGMVLSNDIYLTAQEDSSDIDVRPIITLRDVTGQGYFPLLLPAPATGNLNLLKATPITLDSGVRFQVQYMAVFGRDWALLGASDLSLPATSRLTKLDTVLNTANITSWTELPHLKGMLVLQGQPTITYGSRTNQCLAATYRTVGRRFAFGRGRES